MARLLVLTKRQYMNKDLLDDRFGRFRELPLAISGLGHSVTGLCLSYRHRTEGVFRDGPVVWQSVNAGVSGLGVFKFIIAAYLRMRNVDAVWAGSDSVYGILACLLGKIHNVPIIFDIYDNFDKFFIGQIPLLRQLYHWAIRRSDALTTFSKPFARYLLHQHCRHKNVTVIENAVRTNLFRPLAKSKCRRMLGLPEGALIIGTAGALYKKRQVDLLFDAYRKLSAEMPQLHLAVAGPRDASIQIPWGEKIHDAGVLAFEKVPLFVNALDIAVICYADDDYGKYCFPQKTREIMACNTPLIGANVGSLKEIFADHPEWLYRPGSATSLAQAIAHRLTHLQTGYEAPPTWQSMAKIFESVMDNAIKCNSIDSKSVLCVNKPDVRR